MSRRWSALLILPLLVGLGVWIGITVLQDGRDLEMICLQEEGDSSALAGIQMSGVLVDRDARTPFAQGFVATGPEMKMQSVWEDRIERTAYRKDSVFSQSEPFMTETFSYRFQFVAKQDGVEAEKVRVFRTAEDGRTEMATLEAGFGDWRLRENASSTTLRTPVVLENSGDTYLILPVDNRGDSHIYAIDTWFPVRRSKQADSQVVEPLATVPRSLGNQLAGFFLDGDDLLVVATEDPKYAQDSDGLPEGAARVLLYRYAIDETPLEQMLLPVGEGTLADVACEDGFLFITMARPDNPSEKAAADNEVCVFRLEEAWTSWGVIPLSDPYMPISHAMFSYADRAYRIMEDRLVFAWSEALAPVWQADSATWLYPDGVRLYDNGSGPPRRQAIQLLVYTRTGEPLYRGLYDPGLSQDKLLQSNVYGTERQLAQLRVEPTLP